MPGPTWAGPSGPGASATRDAPMRALDRALELLDLTLADPRWNGPRLREVARTRKVVWDS